MNRLQLGYSVATSPSLQVNYFDLVHRIYAVNIDTYLLTFPPDLLNKRFNPDMTSDPRAQASLWSWLYTQYSNVKLTAGAGWIEVGHQACLSTKPNTLYVAAQPRPSNGVPESSYSAKGNDHAIGSYYSLAGQTISQILEMIYMYTTVNTLSNLVAISHT